MSTLPLSTPAETALDLLSAVVSLVPWLGGPISGLLSGYSNQRKLKRLRDVLGGVANDLRNFSSKASEDYVKTEEFEDLLEQTLRRVADEGGRTEAQAVSGVSDRHN